MELTLEKELREQLEHLAPARQREVLAYVRALAAQAATNRAPQELSRFVGSIEAADLEAMSDVIDAGCEQVDLDEW
ncbi:MAG: hypothetical protein HY899_17620 [Deltaproteobacteria bacterium]|nr:hypothetical protein [Deltaproteobacteria bacterium]